MLLKFVYPGWNAMLQILDHFEAHTLPFNTRFKHILEFCTQFCNLEDTHTTLLLRNEKEQQQKHCISNLFFHLIKHSWFWSV